MTVYDLMMMCDDVSFEIGNKMYDVWELEEKVNELIEAEEVEDDEDEEEKGRRICVRTSDLEDLEVEYIFGGKYGTVVLHLEDSLEDVLEYLREYA